MCAYDKWYIEANNIIWLFFSEWILPFKLIVARIQYSILNASQDFSTVGQADAVGMGSFKLNDFVKLTGPEISMFAVVSDNVFGPNSSPLFNHFQLP